MRIIETSLFGERATGKKSAAFDLDETPAEPEPAESTAEFSRDLPLGSAEMDTPALAEPANTPLDEPTVSMVCPSCWICVMLVMCS